MNSLERTSFSRELMNNRQVYPQHHVVARLRGYHRDYMNGSIDYNEFARQASYYGRSSPTGSTC